MRLTQKALMLWVLSVPIKAAEANTQLGKISVKLEITAKAKIFIEKPGGGWYQSLQLRQQVGNMYNYQVDVPLTVKLSHDASHRFQVRLKTPLVLQRQSSFGQPARYFSSMQVRWGEDRTSGQILSDTPIVFTQKISTATTS